MTKNTWRPAIWGVALGLLAALAAWPQAASAAISGDTFTITARLHTNQGTGPFVTDVTVGPGAELADGSGTLGGYPRTGESVDCRNVQCVFTFAPLGLQGAFELSGLDSLIEQNLLEITITGDLVASSDSHLTVANEEGSSFARFTVDCNPFLAVNPCQGGTVEVNFVFAPAGAPPGGEEGDPLQALMDLKTAVIDQQFDPETEEKLTRRLDTAIRRLENGNTAGAIRRLDGFIQKVERGQVTGAIGAVGDALIAVAEEIKAQILAA